MSNIGRGVCSSLEVCLTEEELGMSMSVCTEILCWCEGGQWGRGQWGRGS
jgi:hypothetical protein